MKHFKNAPKSGIVGKTPKIAEPEAPLDARMRCFGSYVPVKNIVIVDTKQKIWRGDRIVEPGTPEDAMMIVYFNRTFDKDSDLDKLFHEYVFTDNTILGFEFWLIPKEKLLFGYDPPSSIIKPALKFAPGGPFTH